MKSVSDLQRAANAGAALRYREPSDVAKLGSYRQDDMPPDASPPPVLPPAASGEFDRLDPPPHDPIVDMATDGIVAALMKGDTATANKIRSALEKYMLSQSQQSTRL